MMMLLQRFQGEVFIVNISVDDFEAMHKFGMDKNKRGNIRER
ncbi:MAG: hypothetical protein ACLT33_03920 [Lachnospira pectinoschiza]